MKYFTKTISKYSIETSEKTPLKIEHKKKK